MSGLKLHLRGEGAASGMYSALSGVIRRENHDQRNPGRQDGRPILRSSST